MAARKPEAAAGAKKPAAKKPALKPAKPASKKPAAKPAAKNPPAKKAKPAAKKPRGPQGLPEQLRDAALKVLDDRQAEDVVSFDLRGRSSMADYVIVASSRAARQSVAIAHYLREAFAKLGATQLRVEGQQEGNWVLADAGDVIVHLFRPEVRSYYNLEQIWQRRAETDE